MKKCPSCGTEADLIISKPVEESGTCSRPSTHLIGGVTCLRKRLTRSEERRTVASNALADFRHAILHDTYITDEVRYAVLGHLDDALSPVRDE